jgi:hypothetical protein
LWKVLLDHRSVEGDGAVLRSRGDVRHINPKEELSSTDEKRYVTKPNLLTNARTLPRKSSTSPVSMERREQRRGRGEKEEEEECNAPTDTSRMSLSVEEHLNNISRWLKVA